MEGLAREEAEPARAFWRIVVVGVISLFSIFSFIPDIILPWHPTAEFGFQVDSVGHVIGIAPGSPAERAGITSADRLDLAASAIDSRRYVPFLTMNVAKDGQRARFSFVRGETERTVDLTATVAPRSIADNVTDVLLVLSQLAVVMIAAPLVLSRPSLMTWWFFLYATGVGGSVAVTNIANLPLYALIAMSVLMSLYSFQWYWLVLFALRFPNDAPTGWRRGMERALFVALPFVAAYNALISNGYFFGLQLDVAFFNSWAIFATAAFLFAVFTFVVTYVHAQPADRARIRWVMLGLVLGLGAALVYQIGVSVPGIAFAWPLWVINIAQSGQVIVAATVVYAIVRHRVFDVRFFIGRAVVYGMLTTAVVATLALFDFAVGKLLAGSRIAGIGEAGLAVLVGLSLNGVHKKLERLVDSTLFRSRIVAQRRLHRVTRGLSHATTLGAIENAVISEPVAAFHLTSAAIFTRDGDGSFVRGSSIGWDSGTIGTIDGGDPLVLQLLGTEDAVPAREVTTRPGDLPHGDHRPSVVMQMRVRSQLWGIVFYGPHASQEDLDPDEVRSLEELLVAASSAYDHVRAETVQRRLDAMLESRGGTFDESLVKRLIPTKDMG